jgi:hypothetical protein
MDGRAQNSRRLQSIDTRRVYRASELCELLSLPDEFLRSLVTLLKSLPLQPTDGCFFDGAGRLWCRVGTVRLHLERTRQARAAAAQPEKGELR